MQQSSSSGQGEPLPSNFGIGVDAGLDVRLESAPTRQGEQLERDGPEETLRSPSETPPGPARVASQRKPVFKAHSLIDKVYNWKNLWTAWRKVRRNKGAHGLDRVTIRAYEQDVETHLRELQRKLMENRYEPLPVRRVYIPKASDPSQRRPLGVPIPSS